MAELILVPPTLLRDDPGNVDSKFEFQDTEELARKAEWRLLILHKLDCFVIKC